jgi:hypothetical protein
MSFFAKYFGPLRQSSGVTSNKIHMRSLLDCLSQWILGIGLVMYQFLHGIGCMCVVLGENGLFRIFDHWCSVEYYASMLC